MKELDIRHISIFDSLPVYNCKKEVLVVGSGNCLIDAHLKIAGYQVISTDYYEVRNSQSFESQMKKVGTTNISIDNCNIFNLKSFSKSKYETVICAEVLEHLKEYKIAFQNLLSLTEKRLIITVPWERSFNDTRPAPIGHCNYWSDKKTNKYKDINEFVRLSSPYAISIQKIRTKPKDVKMKQYGYLIIVDKRQRWNTGHE